MAFTVTTEAFHEAVALLLQQKEAFSVKMYIEYASSPSPPSQATVQATGDHKAYYSGLSGPDYLRVDVSQFSSVVSSGHFQKVKTLDYTNNKITFTGFTSAGGSSGVHGVAISGKKVYGAAIALSNNKTNTPATDVIIARAYFDSSDFITVATAKGASVQVALNLIDQGACTGFATGSVTFTGIPTNGGTVTLIDNADTPVTKVFEFNDTVTTANGSTINSATGGGSATNICVGTSGLTGSLATATFTFSDKPDEGSTITLTDGDGTAVTFEIDNENNGAAGSNVAVNGISGAGGGATGTAADLVAKINAQGALDIVATNPSTGRVVLTAGSFGTAGNTAISVNNATHWNSKTSVNVPSAFTGGDGTALETIEDRFEGAVNGVASFAITASDDAATSGKVTLTQDHCGTTGNTTITDSATSVTVTSFTGGA